MQVQIGRYMEDGDNEDTFERQEHVVIHSYDTWNMDHTLALIIHPMLIQLQRTKHGSPCVDDEDVPAELMSKYADEKGDPNTGYTDSNWHKRWDWVLEEMIWAFKQKLDDEDDSQYWGEWVEDDSKTLGGYHKNVDWDGLEKHKKRITNGFRLFGKYYEALWD